MATPQGPAQGQPTPQQIQAMQRQIAAEAAKHNMSVEQYVAQLKAQAMRQAQAQQPGQQQPGQPPQQQQQPPQGQQVPINPGPPNPQALALCQWLRSQALKTRTCILDGQRKDMFRVKRALRALESPAYAAACKKNPALPPVGSRAGAEETFKLLPLSLLALRVSKIDPHEGHGHGKPKKRVKGLWTVKVEQQQDVKDELHFIWVHEGPQWKTKLYAAGALALIMAVVLFPLWPIKLRIGVWYLSMGMLGLIGLFFAMAIFRLLLFCITVFAVPPGLWLYPNLFEDVGFFDSFRPVWGWQEEKKTKKRKKASAADSKNVATAASNATTTTGASVETESTSAPTQRRNLTPRVEEVEDD